MRHFLRLLVLSGTVCLGCLLLTGCDKQARAQAQCVADAKAGAAAVEGLPPGQPVPYDLAIGLAHNVSAATANIPDLPTPTMTPLEIGKDPAAYAKPAAISAADPPKYEPAKAAAPAIDILAPLKSDALLAVRLGALVGILGSILWVASMFIDVASLAPGLAGIALGFIARLSFIWRIAASLGGVAVVLGGCALWALDHPWVIVGAIAAALAWVGLVHHKDIGAFWHRLLGLLHATIGRLHLHTATVAPPAIAPPPETAPAAAAVSTLAGK